jgi:D-alanyl-lipoteichoic acid acyltransferase DltB (MBOAT superfamily)
MLFNSLEFAFFFIVVLIAYTSLSHRNQNYMLLAASYVFYGAWDYRFLLLLMLSTVVDYYIALWISRQQDPERRKRLLWVSIALNLGILGFFKYFNFFTTSFVDLASTFGVTMSPVMLGIVLPVGISFYTFQSMSYTIDVYRRDLEPSRSLTDFALYVAFFPQLVAGPIERATRLLPQITSTRIVTPGRIGSGLYLMLLGLFKKVVVADNLAPTVDRLFGQTYVTGEEVLMGAIYFGFQIYCDFSGYSDIARGAARIMGFELVLNFKQPFFAKSPSDLMRRWHISLGTWMRDYVFYPLGGSRGSNLRTFRNLTIVMVLGGLWHGAAWNFALWGVYFSLLMVGYRAYDVYLKPHLDAALANVAWIAAPRAIAAILTMYTFNLYGFMMFRCVSLGQIVDMTAALGNFTSVPLLLTMTSKLLPLVGPVLLLDYFEYRGNEDERFTRAPLAVQTAGYTAVIMLFLMIGQYDGSSFIYFQF